MSKSRPNIIIIPPACRGCGRVGGLKVRQTISHNTDPAAAIRDPASGRLIVSFKVCTLHCDLCGQNMIARVEEPDTRVAAPKRAGNKVAGEVLRARARGDSGSPAIPAAPVVREDLMDQGPRPKG